MSQIFVYCPISKEAHWLLSLKIAERKNRVSVCLNKITRLFYQSRLGVVASRMTLYCWYIDIRQIEGYFDKEITRLSKLIKRKVKGNIQYQVDSKQSYHFKVTNPIAASLYRLIHKFDTLSCLSETCLTLLIFKKRRLFEGKLARYKKSIMQVITRISQYKREEAMTNLELTDDQKAMLSLSLQSEVMPILSKAKLNALKTIVDS